MRSNSGSFDLKIGKMVIVERRGQLTFKGNENKAAFRNDIDVVRLHWYKRFWSLKYPSIKLRQHLRQDKTTIS